MLVVVHHIYQAFNSNVLVFIWSPFMRVHHLSEIMKPNPRLANHHEDFYLKSFSETPSNQSNLSIAKETTSYFI